MSELKNLELQESQFEQEVLGSAGRVLVKFWAPNCGGCKMVNSILKSVAPQINGSVKVCSVNIEDQPALAANYSVRAVPTLMLFRDGECKETKVGPQMKAALLDFIGIN